MARRKTTMSLDERAALPIAEENPGIEYLRLNRQEICEREINSAIRCRFAFNRETPHTIISIR